ncbi:polyamine ABC transporter permease [Prosthecomicrobium hirschii]|uniref:Polyamine ABC transporter permease n=1 Tax=Prosthecodimorpha hirschii TaxID=665126 RepID=A0A0P6VL33_9HYPH|nr:ABC transporter permease [Prosthecomicrobium hirschii]KPL53388.1 polyamine ABC transporter permease [Prosthecomicrobium hirschii]TPQ50990.1 ABC transporter permease [Prosthecomicrobium hirschii]
MISPRFVRRLSRLLQYGLLSLFFAFVAMPMAVIVVFSFDANRFPSIPWGGFSLVWHEAAWADPMIREAFVNSIWVGLGTAVLSTAIGFAAAYIDFRHRFFGKRLFVFAVAIPPAVPTTILGMAMLAFVSRIGLSGRLETIVACHVAVASSFAMALIRLRLGEFGRDLEPAAWNLGASPWAGLRFVVLPFCRPALIAAFFLSAAVSFDEYMIAWFVGGVHETLPVRILNQLQGQVNPKINAIGAGVLAVSLVLVFLARRFTNLRPEPMHGPDLRGDSA